jgi:hypothetical protein
MPGTDNRRIEWDDPQGSSESYRLVTIPAMSDPPSQGSNRGDVRTAAHMSHLAARTGGHMPSSTPDWSALGSEHERLADGLTDQGPSAPAAQLAAAQPGRHRAAAAAARRPRWRGRTARGAAAGTAAVLAVTGAASASAAAATTGSASWHIIARVHSGVFGDFTAVTATSKTGGWAFDGIAKSTAYQRHGSTWKKTSFPAKSGAIVIQAESTSASNVWAFTGDGGPSQALRWNGSHWTVMRSFSDQIGGATVVSARDVWVFGTGSAGGAGALGAWHYNGHTWTHVSSGHGLEGGSGLSASNAWSFAGTDVAHWNGHTWTRTSVKGLLPAKQELNDPAVAGIDAQSRNSVYAVGSGNQEDEGGPLVVLHYNGHTWRRVAEGSDGVGTFPDQQVSSDGHGGLWIPMPGADGQRSFLLHYSGGHLTRAALPTSSSKIDVETVALIPHTTDMLGGGFTHGSNNPGTHVVAVILQYGG